MRRLIDTEVFQAESAKTDVFDLRKVDLVKELAK